MNAVATPHDARRQGQRTWTDAQRAEQAEKLHARKIWLLSTGPRTERGKSISRCNALKHGACSRPAKDFMKHFKAYRAFLRLCWEKRAEIIAKQKNELIDPVAQKRAPRRKLSRIVKSQPVPTWNLPPVTWHFVPLPPSHSSV